MALLIRRALSAVLLLVAVRAGSAPPAPTEYQVKAAFLCSFPDFVEWPTTARNTVTIGILGEDPFGAALVETVRERGHLSKELVIRHLARADEARECEILFVSASENARLGQVLGALKGANVLTVSDISGFAGRGGIIGFTLEERRVRFQINVDAAEQARLRISSRLLKLARIVGGAAVKGAT